MLNKMERHRTCLYNNNNNNNNDRLTAFDPGQPIFLGKQWYQLPELIPTNSNSGLHSCISISIPVSYTHLTLPTKRIV